MCCRTKVFPLHRDIAIAQLEIGQFTTDGFGRWMRTLTEEHTSVMASLTDEGLILSLSPAVSSLAGHHEKRIAASVMYSIAALYAEKVNGVIEQTSINVKECQEHGSSRTLAVYPESRLDFSMLCPGFRVVFLGEES